MNRESNQRFARTEDKEKKKGVIHCSLLSVHCYLLSVIRSLPITLPGLALLVISLVVLIRSLSARNAYEIFLSAAAQIFLIALGFSGYWKQRHLAALEPLLKPPFPLGAASKEDWLIVSSVVKLPVFFRLHFILKGHFFPQGTSSRGDGSLKAGGCPVFAQSTLPKGSDTTRLSMSFPLGGLFLGNLSCRLRDVFGLFSFPCGIPTGQRIMVRSSPCSEKPLRIEALSGAEDRRTKNANDEERYYMREYTPGDRFRDINWKSSEKIDTLITRISPDNQEKVTRVQIFFRNFGPDRPTISELWLLDRAKARLAWFLRSVKSDNGAAANTSYEFNVKAAANTWELKDQDEIEAFLEELAALPFSPGQSEELYALQPEAAAEIYVFSTACDAALTSFLMARQGKPASLFLTQHALQDGASVKPEEITTLRLRDFPAGGLIPLPGWLLPAGKRASRLPRRSPALATGRVMIDYAKTGL